MGDLNLKDYLLSTVLVEEPSKLQMDLSKLLEKSEFMKMVKESLTKKEEEK